MIRILQSGNWSPAQLTVEWTSNTRRQIPQVESAIETAWTKALARPEVQLFDGPMCRLESWTASENQLALKLSKSSYKIFLGTNMAHPEFAETLGSEVMANPVGVSPALLTIDQQLLLGRRSSTVAYYPNRVHPFAGSMEPADPNPFASITRELKEELSLQPNDLRDIRCIGIAEDKNLRQPELIFAVTTHKSHAEIQATLDPVEHQGLWSIPAAQAQIEHAVTHDQQLTPVATAALLLWGRLNFGQSWFDRMIV